MALSPAAVLARVEALRAEGADPWVFGEGLLAHADGARRAASAPGPTSAPRPPSRVARLAAPALEAASYDDARLFALEPHYVRASEAEVKFPNGLPGLAR